ncbi:MAG: hypothetical protein HQL58_00900 [Magnetococcales bacterium]|nr:hypothetical protein [Magnetococcales bacterium]
MEYPGTQRVTGGSLRHLYCYRWRVGIKAGDGAVTRADDVPDIVTGDSNWTGQILARLLDNAFKFTAAGSVSLKIVLERHPKQEDELVFAILDTGPGVAPEIQEEIFEHFTCGAKDPRTEHQGGIGMGLAICQQAIGLMKGHVWIEQSGPGGSEFRFSIPCGNPAELTR